MRKITLITVATLLAVSTNAQEIGVKSYGFGDNWFIQGQGGISYNINENSSDGKMKVLSPHAAISLGKYFSPQAGARLQFGGWESKTYLPKTDKTYSVDYLQANLDGLFNLGNIFTKFEGERSFNLYGILGAGFVYGFKNKSCDIAATKSIVPRMGLQADFSLTPNLGLNFEVVGNLMSDDFNGISEGRKYDATVNGLVGLTYRFGNGFQTIESVDPAVLISLNDKINSQLAQLSDKDRQILDLRSTVSGLERRLAEKKPEEIIKTDTEVLMNAVVVFRLGSAKLEQNQDINIYNAAKYLQDNQDVNIIVTGYADKATGTAQINQRLSEQRAQAVADILTKTYGINANRITVEASGDRVQPFQIDAWNRVVIFTAK